MGAYVIQPGDTLSALARRYGTTVEALAQANGIRDANMIRAGATLQVPDGQGSPMQPTTGAVPRPRPQQQAQAVPLPNPRPEAQAPPLPRPNPGAPLPNPRPAPPLPPGSATRDYSIPIQAAGLPQMPTGGTAADFRQALQQLAPSRQPNPDAYAGWQGASYRDHPPPRQPLGPQGHGGWPDFTAMTMPQLQTFLQRWQSVGRSWDDLPPMFNEVWNARMEQARADAVIAQNQLDNHHTAFRGIFGTDPRVAPPAPPVDTSIGEGEYLPAEYAVLGQLANNMASAPRAVTSPQLPFRGGFTRGPTLGNLVGPRV